MPLDQIDVEKYKWDPEEERLLPEGDKEMSFFDHLEELRWHVIRSLIAICIAGIGLYLVEDWYFRYVLLGPTHEDFPSYALFCNLSEYLHLGGALCFEPPKFQTIATGFAEAFITSIKMCFVGGIVLAFPYVFYEIWRFISPGLYAKERRVTRGVVFICSALFLMGVLFGFYVIAPFAVNFLAGYNLPGVANTPTLQSVIGYMTMFTLPAGMIFELPVVVYFMARLGIITAQDMRTYRRHSIIGILIVAAIVTPPDVVTQMLIAIPLWVLYEVSVLVAIRAQKQYEAEGED